MAGNWTLIKKHCPGCCDPGETIPTSEFAKDKTQNDGRSKYCKGCVEDGLDKFDSDLQAKASEIEPAPVVEEKKRRGMPKGGWPKKEAAEAKHNIPDWISGKIDHPSKPLPEITKNTPSQMPESSPTQNTPLKFDLSAFQKITFDRRVLGEPTLRIGDTNEIAFNVCATRAHGLMETKSFDAYIDRGPKTSRIALVPKADESGAFKAQHQPSYCYFNSIKLIRHLNVKPGRYAITESGGALIIEAENNEI